MFLIPAMERIFWYNFQYNEDVTLCTVFLIFNKDSTISYGKNEYYFSNDKKNWTDAEESCKKFGGHLASVHSAAEDAFLNKEKDKRLVKRIAQFLACFLRYYVY